MLIFSSTNERTSRHKTWSIFQHRISHVQPYSISKISKKNFWLAIHSFHLPFDITRKNCSGNWVPHSFGAVESRSFSIRDNH